MRSLKTVCLLPEWKRHWTIKIFVQGLPKMKIANQFWQRGAILTSAKDAVPLKLGALKIYLSLQVGLSMGIPCVNSENHKHKKS